jgi:hypothetical protein
VPLTTSRKTERWSYPVASPAVTVVVRVVTPLSSGTSTANAPDGSAVAVNTEVAPVSRLLAATATRAPGAVVPVTVVAGSVTSLRSAGAVTVRGAAGGGGAST